MDFKEQAIYEFEKDNAFTGAREFRMKVKEKYDLIPNSDLYRRIVNYQIKKYGGTLTGAKHQEFVPKTSINRNSKRRMQEKDYYTEYEKSKRIIERAHNEKN